MPGGKTAMRGTLQPKLPAFHQLSSSSSPPRAHPLDAAARRRRYEFAFSEPSPAPVCMGHSACAWCGMCSSMKRPVRRVSVRLLLNCVALQPPFEAGPRMWCTLFVRSCSGGLYASSRVSRKERATNGEANGRRCDNSDSEHAAGGGGKKLPAIASLLVYPPLLAAPLCILRAAWVLGRQQQQAGCQLPGCRFQGIVPALAGCCCCCSCCRVFCAFSLFVFVLKKFRLLAWLALSACRVLWWL